MGLRKQLVPVGQLSFLKLFVVVQTGPAGTDASPGVLQQGEKENSSGVFHNLSKAN